jgi:hypothetical protein
VVVVESRDWVLDGFEYLLRGKQANTRVARVRIFIFSFFERVIWNQNVMRRLAVIRTIS